MGTRLPISLILCWLVAMGIRKIGTFGCGTNITSNARGRILVSWRIEHREGHYQVVTVGEWRDRDQRLGLF